MKSILYSGGIVVTGDRIADAVLEYASELARHESSDTVRIPTLNEAGESGLTQLLLGPASQFVVEEVDLPFDEPIDEVLLGAITEKTMHLQDPKPVASKDTIDYPDIDDATETPDPPLADS